MQPPPSSFLRSIFQVSGGSQMVPGDLPPNQNGSVSYSCDLRVDFSGLAVNVLRFQHRRDYGGADGTSETTIKTLNILYLW